MEKEVKAKIKIICAMLIFGSIGIFVKSIPLSSAEIALIRGTIGAVFLFGTMAVMKDKVSVKLLKENFWLLLASGAAIGINWICLFEAYRYTAISTATLCYYVAPVFVILLSPFLLKERLTIWKLGCAAAALAGMLMIAGESGIAADNKKGILFGVTAALLYAAIVIINKFLKNISALESTALQLAVAAAVVLPYVLKTEGTIGASCDKKTIVLILTVGIVHTGFAYLLYFSAVRDLKGQTAAIFSYIDPLSAIIFSMVFFQEKLSLPQIIGAMLILGSTLISEIAGGFQFRKKRHING